MLYSSKKNYNHYLESPFTKSINREKQLSKKRARKDFFLTFPFQYKIILYNFHKLRNLKCAVHFCMVMAENFQKLRETNVKLRWYQCLSSFGFSHTLLLVPCCMGMWLRLYLGMPCLFCVDGAHSDGSVIPEIWVSRFGWIVRWKFTFEFAYKLCSEWFRGSILKTPIFGYPTNH